MEVPVEQRIKQQEVELETASQSIKLKSSVGVGSVGRSKEEKLEKMKQRSEQRLLS
jgi:hypothetical protein